MRVISASPLKEHVTNAMGEKAYIGYPATKLSPEFRHATKHLSDYFKGANGDQNLLAELEAFVKDDFGWWIELQLSISTSSLSLVSDAVVN